MLTTVVNAETGEVRCYTLGPREALVAAWRQARGDWNTWDDSREEVPVLEGRWHLFAGDWAVRKEPTKGPAEGRGGRRGGR